MAPRKVKANATTSQLCGVCNTSCSKTASLQCQDCKFVYHDSCLPMNERQAQPWISTDMEFICSKCVKQPFFLERCLQRILSASGVEELQKKCNNEKALLKHYRVKLPRKSSHSEQACTDTISLNILQKYQPSLTSDYRPLKTGADGNCLYRAISAACFGSEDHHILLRILTILEMAEHPTWYDTKNKNYCSPFRNNPWFILGDYESYLCRTASLGSYSDMNHILALTAVLGIPIQSYYPPGE